MKWYQTKLRRILVDMHIADWNKEFMSQFSAENYAHMMRQSGAEVAQITAGSCLGLCYWPTDIGFRHKQLHGRDILGETLEACHAEGLATQIFLNTWNREAYEKYPQWRMIFENGLGSVEYGYDNGRFGLCCPNTGYQDFFISMLDELNKNYNTLGFWIDMVGYWNVICYCPTCRMRFREESFYEDLPRVIDWNNPHWNAFVKFREHCLNEFARKIYITIKNRTPERSVTFQSGALRMGWLGGGNSPEFFQCGDYLAEDLSGDRFEQVFCSKMYSALSKNKPIEFMLSRCEHLSHHTTPRTMDDMKMLSFAALANQTSFTLIDAIDPIGTLDRRFYEYASQINSTYALYESYIKGTSVPLTDCAIYYSADSQVNIDISVPVEQRMNAVSRSPRCFANIARTFSEAHILFSFAAADSDLTRFPVLILSDCARLSEEECEIIRAYVYGGGKLYASYATSLYDPDEGICKDFKLADIFGVNYTGTKTVSGTYISPTEDSFLNKFCSKQYPVMLNSGQICVKAADNSEILGNLTLPCSNPNERNYFSSAISNPPWIWTDSPAVVHHKHGKGEVIYFAGKLEEVEFNFQRNIFANLIKSLAPGIVSTNAPKWVEITLFDQPENGCLILAFLNRPSDLPPSPQMNIKTVLKLPKIYKVEKLLVAPDESEIPFKMFPEGFEFVIETLNEFALFIITYKTTIRRQKNEIAKQQSQ